MVSNRPHFYGSNYLKFSHGFNLKFRLELTRRSDIIICAFIPVDLARMAGLTPAGVLCEILDDAGGRTCDCALASPEVSEAGGASFSRFRIASRRLTAQMNCPWSSARITPWLAASERGLTTQGKSTRPARAARSSSSEQSLNRGAGTHACINRCRMRCLSWAAVADSTELWRSPNAADIAAPTTTAWPSTGTTASIP